MHQSHLSDIKVVIYEVDITFCGPSFSNFDHFPYAIGPDLRTLLLVGRCNRWPGVHSYSPELLYRQGAAGDESFFRERERVWLAHADSDFPVVVK